MKVIIRTNTLRSPSSLSYYLNPIRSWNYVQTRLSFYATDEFLGTWTVKKQNHTISKQEIFLKKKSVLKRGQSAAISHNLGGCLMPDSVSNLPHTFPPSQHYLPTWPRLTNEQTADECDLQTALSLFFWRKKKKYINSVLRYITKL